MPAPAPQAKKKTAFKYVVMKDDGGGGLMFPMTRSAECLGAICNLLPSEENPIALFDSRQEAQTAIRISTRIRQPVGHDHKRLSTY